METAEGVLESQEKAVGYRELLRTNNDFRNLWCGQVISELGDWLATVALLNLMLELTGRAQILGWFFIVIHLPSVFLGPLSGVLVDRMDRKKLMIAMDLARAIVVLGYLLIRQAEYIWLVYVLAALEVAMMTLFEPARTASIPNLCRPRELVAANALSGITWSAVLAIGAALGGLMAAVLGRDVCYLLDSLSFIASACFISRVRLATRKDSPGESRASLKPASGLRDIVDGIKYLRACPRVAAVMLVKGGWGFGGGILLILGVFGERIFPIMGSGAAGIGTLYTMRGIGALLGPLIARRLTGDRVKAMRAWVTAGFFMAAASYTLFGQAGSLPIAAVALAVAHMGGSILWVFSTVLLQIEVPDIYRGRVFAIEQALMTLGIGVSNYAAGYLLDVVRMNPRTVATLLGGYFLLPAILWLAGQRLFRK